MATRRRSIPLTPEENSLLQKLYLIYRIPSDQYRRRPEAVTRYLRDWENLSGRVDCWEDICHYIICRRKDKKWPTLNGDYLRLADPDWDVLNAREWAALEDEYRAVVLSREVGSDQLMFDQPMVSELARGFARRTKRSLSGPVLVALIVSRRKRGEWVHLRPEADGDLNFSDIGKIA